MTQIELTWGDILTMGGDALVCPAHKYLIRGRGLSAQIYAHCGTQLTPQCTRQRACPVGEARLTKAYDLPVDYLLHTVTPQWSSGDQWGSQAIVQLRCCYESVLKLAEQRGCKKILFPALGAGTNRFPHEIAAHQGLAVLRSYAASFERLTVCLHSPTALAQWQKIERRFYGPH
ncbi:macro domain-containing protein [Microbulbifer sp. OS29]|uniref:Macro domain-containing protein n=1 Tax=Microbulbifer okhotskensis TaxID=2926617 RepID=A0A9X2EI77_9GAMM|nr:macro domain-containing protein [Microbulbifer okhotskensis]MCO1332719.1 macro domain-containing protein [Microbulbifer okhotskensis]